MMEKVKLTQEQADAITWATDRQGRDLSHAELITVHAEDNTAWDGKAKGLKRLSLLTLVDALRIGYEVEEEYKVGDWVVTKGSNRIAKITRIVDGYLVYGYWNNRDEEKWNPIKEIRHASPEEIKAEQERILWKSIGREVGELRKGDVYISKDDLTYTYDGLERNKFFYDKYKSGKFKGFYPAESFISFGGGEEE